MKRLTSLSIVVAACALSPLGCSSTPGADMTGSGGVVDAGTGGAGSVASGGALGSGGTDSSGGTSSSGGDSALGGANGSGASDSGGVPGSGGTEAGSGGTGSGGVGSDDCEDTGAAEDFSFFVTSYHHIVELSGSDDGFGGDLRWNGATTGLEGADALCQEMARRVCHGQKTWKAFLSTSAEDAIDRIGSGPWYDYAGELVADSTAGLLSGDRPAGGCCDDGTFDELGTFHDGTTDVNDDGIDDDDHDTLTSTYADGTYSGFSCEDWTSTTAVPTDDFPMGHTWPAQSGQSWMTAHDGHGCQAGTNFIQGGGGNGESVGASGGYGAFYCFATGSP